jgi:hypothetical protein
VKKRLLIIGVVLLLSTSVIILWSTLYKLEIAVQRCRFSDDPDVVLAAIHEIGNKRIQAGRDWRSENATVLMAVASRESQINVNKYLAAAMKYANGLDETDAAGRTAMSYAIESHNSYILLWLVHRNASVTQLDRAGGSIVEIALNSGYIPLFGMLQVRSLNDAECELLRKHLEFCLDSMLIDEMYRLWKKQMNNLCPATSPANTR